MKRVVIGYKLHEGNHISATGRNLLKESGFDVLEDNEKFGIIVDTNEKDESIDEMLEVIVTTKAKNDSDFKSFLSRCIKGEWEV